METTTTNPDSPYLPSSQLDLYTIPTHSCWFSWDSIHDTERIELREFFDGSSFTRTPKIYKDYRDFIISKFREDPSTRLTFTEVRKSLVGDVCVLRKVFDFLDKWGLINFDAPPGPPDPNVVVVEDQGVKVRVEEGAPVGVRVVVAPGSLKPLLVPAGSGSGSGSGSGTGGGFRVAPLASYKDVFGGGVVCGSCKGKCGSRYYDCIKEKYTICLTCFEKGAFGENKANKDFKLNETTDCSAVWTEAETLLLLESVLKHGDDWELVAKNVQTKTKLECISRLIELPFGELMLGSREKFSSKGTVVEGDAGKDQKASGDIGLDTSTPSGTATGKAGQDQKTSSSAAPEQNASSNINQEQKASGDGDQLQKASNGCQENSEMEDNLHQEIIINHHQETLDINDQEITVRENGEEIGGSERPSKRSRIDSTDPSRSLMEQVAIISTMVGPRIKAAAANAAVSVVSDGNPIVRDIFYLEDDAPTDERISGNLDMELERASHSEDTEMKDASHSSEVEKISSVKESIPLALRMRGAVATALGAAAAHARLLADQEEREIEQLMAFIIETQLKKLECKIKHFEDLERLMEKEHTLLEEAKDSIIEERTETLRRILSAGISRMRDYNNSLKLTTSSV